MYFYPLNTIIRNILKQLPLEKKMFKNNKKMIFIAFSLATVFSAQANAGFLAHTVAKAVVYTTVSKSTEAAIEKYKKVHKKTKTEAAQN